MAIFGSGSLLKRGEVSIPPRALQEDSIVFFVGFNIDFALFDVADADKVPYTGTYDQDGNVVSVNFPTFDTSDDLGNSSSVSGTVIGTDPTDSSNGVTQGDFPLFEGEQPYWFSFFGTDADFELFTGTGTVLGAQISADVSFPLFEGDLNPYFYGIVEFPLFTGTGVAGEYRPHGDAPFELFTGEWSILPGITVLSVNVEMPLFEASQVISANVDFPLFAVLNEYPSELVTGIAWCNNIRFEDGPETTKFENFDFLHVIRLGDAYYGVKANGLYQLGGYTDGAAQINSTLAIAPNNLNDLHLKRCNYMYLDSQNTMSVSPVVDEMTYGPYIAGFNSRRVVMGKGIVGVSWGFTIRSVGAPFKINGVEPMFESLSRKVP